MLWFSQFGVVLIQQGEGYTAGKGLFKEIVKGIWQYANVEGEVCIFIIVVVIEKCRYLQFVVIFMCVKGRVEVFEVGFGFGFLQSSFIVVNFLDEYVIIVYRQFFQFSSQFLQFLSLSVYKGIYYGQMWFYVFFYVSCYCQFRVLLVKFQVMGEGRRVISGGRFRGQERGGMGRGWQVFSFE